MPRNRPPSSGRSSGGRVGLRKTARGSTNAQLVKASSESRDPIPRRSGNCGAGSVTRRLAGWPCLDSNQGPQSKAQRVTCCYSARPFPPVRATTRRDRHVFSHIAGVMRCPTSAKFFRLFLPLASRVATSIRIAPGVGGVQTPLMIAIADGDRSASRDIQRERANQEPDITGRVHWLGAPTTVSSRRCVRTSRRALARLPPRRELAT